MGGKQLQFTFHNNYDPDLVIGSGTAYGIIDLDGFDGSDFDVTTEDYGFDQLEIGRASCRERV